jgi:glyoxylase-like metal-dependent hydrolase (beta-lactamase superfamily II)
MRIADRVEALELVMSFMGGESTIHPTLLWAGDDGATLIDTGVPGLLPQIGEKLRALGLQVSDIRRILITHQDVDHIGSAQALVEATGARVFAHEADVPYIEGERRLLKMDSSRFEQRIKTLPADQRERIRALLASPPRVKVDQKLSGGEELPFHGGIVVIPTPGHTPGHVCYYVKSSALLVAGDALIVKDGNLEGPNPAATPDMSGAIASLARLLTYPAERVLCYHGGLYTGDVAARLRELAKTGE